MLYHITELETIANKLRDINVPVTESQILTKIISTLPPRYRGFMSARDSVPIPDQTMNSLTSLLLKEECLTKQWNRGKLDQQDDAFFIQNFPPSRWADYQAPRGRGRGKSGRDHRKIIIQTDDIQTEPALITDAVVSDTSLMCVDRESGKRNSPKLSTPKPYQLSLLQKKRPQPKEKMQRKTPPKYQQHVFYRDTH